MNLVLGICAAVAALVGLGLLWWRSRVGREIALMASLETSGAGSVAQLAPGSVAEVKGTLRVRAPLDRRILQQPAAYYKSEIEREETYYERDSQGREERRPGPPRCTSNMQFGQCLVEDQTGRVGIDFDGAKVEAIQVVNEPTAAPSAGSAVGGVIGGTVGGRGNSNAGIGARRACSRPIFRSMCSAKCAKAD